MVLHSKLGHERGHFPSNGDDTSSSVLPGRVLDRRRVGFRHSEREIWLQPTARDCHSQIHDAGIHPTVAIVVLSRRFWVHDGQRREVHWAWRVAFLGYPLLFQIFLDLPNDATLFHPERIDAIYRRLEFTVSAAEHAEIRQDDEAPVRTDLDRNSDQARREDVDSARPATHVSMVKYAAFRWPCVKVRREVVLWFERRWVLDQKPAQEERDLVVTEPGAVFTASPVPKCHIHHAFCITLIWVTKQHASAVFIDAIMPGNVGVRQRGVYCDRPTKLVLVRGNSTKIPSPRMDPAEFPTDPGRRN